MTLQKLQNLVLRLSNGGWTRYWCHYNYPQNPAKMAIQVLDITKDGFKPVAVNGMEKIGFVRDLSARAPFIYTIQRTNEDGSPFESKL